MVKTVEKPFGVIDIGSNSVRLVLFDWVRRSPTSFFNEKVLCGLGRDISTTGLLNEEGRVRALAALSRFRVIFDKSGIPSGDFVCFATAAVREASDGLVFIKKAQEILDQEISILAGEEEALLAAKGVLSGIPNLQGWVADLGGGSLEIAGVLDGEISHTTSYPFGPFRLTGQKRKAIKALLNDAFKVMKPGGGRGTLCLVGGAWRTMAKVHMARQKYPLRVLHHYRMDAEEARSFASDLSKMSLGDIADIDEISARRVDTIPTAALILRELIDALDPEEVVISAHGVREGIIYDRLSPAERKKDPLIEGAKGMARRRTRDPEIGIEAIDFANDFLEGTDFFPKRLVEAAARLSDISWRDHPNYRRANILHTVLHAPLDGLTHDDRIRLAISLYYRYGGESSSDAKAVGKIIGADDVAKAKILGALLRFAHALVGQTAGIMPACSLTQNKKEIVLEVSQGMTGLVGEVALSRLQSLSELVEKPARVEVRDYS
jgi:exopolyphosphatase / guanosine-5'-triphosphate,3'-diphosphate pyrophosphatase